jgi:hypothetical protein
VRSTAVLRRGPGSVTTEWWQGTGGVGDYGGGANLAGGRLGRPVHGEVAGARSGGIVGEAAGRNKVRGWVCCARKGMVKLKSYNNWTRTQ